MGRAREVWDRIVEVWQTGDVEAIPELYTAEAVYLEPYNPPHNGNLLIQAYLKDYLASREDVHIDTVRAYEDPEGRGIGVEWELTYTAGGRQWRKLPRASFIELDDEGMIVYHRDYM